MYDRGRVPLARKAPHDEGHFFDEEAEEGGDDVMGLTASFLSVQVLRYALSGQLPDTHGGEPNNIISSHAVLRGDNTLPALAKLMLSAFASALLLYARPSRSSRLLSLERLQSTIVSVSLRQNTLLVSFNTQRIGSACKADPRIRPATTGS